LPPSERAKAAVEAFKARCAALTIIDSVDAANEAGKLIKEEIALYKRADGFRVEEKEPHLKKSREVDAVWNPLLKTIKDIGAIPRNLLKKYDDEQREIARREAAEARKAKEAAEAAALEAIEANSFTTQAAIEEARAAGVASMQAEKAAVAKPIFGKQEGVKGVSSRKVWKAEIVNQDLAVAAMMKDPKVIETALDRIQALAREQKENFNVPGAKAFFETVY